MEEIESRDYLVYCIISSTYTNKTYVGITNNWSRRIRQHNGLLANGAKSTHGKGPWNPIIHVTGLNKTQALQLEWAWKHRRSGPGGPKGRIKTLEKLLQLEKWTQRSTLMSEMETHLNVQCAMSQDEYIKLSGTNLCERIRYEFNYDFSIKK